jgi:hypothetical protein
MITLNNFTKKWYLKNKLRQTMSNDEAKLVMEFVKENDMLDDMVELNILADKLN